MGQPADPVRLRSRGDSIARPRVSHMAALLLKSSPSTAYRASRFGLMTEFTSFVAVDSAPNAANTCAREAETEPEAAPETEAPPSAEADFATATAAGGYGSPPPMPPPPPPPPGASVSSAGSLHGNEVWRGGGLPSPPPPPGASMSSAPRGATASMCLWQIMFIVGLLFCTVPQCLAKSCHVLTFSCLDAEVGEAATAAAPQRGPTQRQDPARLLEWRPQGTCGLLCSRWCSCSTCDVCTSAAPLFFRWLTCSYIVERP